MSLTHNTKTYPYPHYESIKYVYPDLGYDVTIRRGPTLGAATIVSDTPMDEDDVCFIAEINVPTGWYADTGAEQVSPTEWLVMLGRI